jgi:hypothetical protein
MTKRKLIVTYDEEARKEWLTGFKKRKDFRRKAAQDQEIDKRKEQLKEERREVGSSLLFSTVVRGASVVYEAVPSARLPEVSSHSSGLQPRASAE